MRSTCQCSPVCAYIHMRPMANSDETIAELLECKGIVFGEFLKHCSIKLFGLEFLLVKQGLII